jgi:hypothetical protein
VYDDARLPREDDEEVAGVRSPFFAQSLAWGDLLHTGRELPTVGARGAAFLITPALPGTIAPPRKWRNW